MLESAAAARYAQVRDATLTPGELLLALYDGLFRFFERMVSEQFNKPSNLQLFTVATTIDEVFAQLDAFTPTPPEGKWFVTK